MTIYLDRIVGAAVVILVICLAGCRRGGPVFDTAWSPQRTYKVQLSGIVTEPLPYSFIQHEITFTASKNDRQFAKGRLWIGDDMDGGFRDNYPRQDWIAENVLRFEATAAAHDRTFDEIVLVNRRSARIPFVLLGYTDRFLVLDFEPNAAVRVKARRSGQGFLWAEAPVEGRSKLVYLTKNVFPGSLPGSAQSPGATYLEVEIGDGQFTVNVPRTGSK